MKLCPLLPMLLVISNIYTGHTKGRPKAAVMINENDESLTVRCEIPGPEDDWTYSWFIEGSSLPFSSDREFSIRTGVSDTSSNVTCRGERESDGQMSEISGAVTLTVSQAPKARLTVQTETSQIFTGDTVTLTCDIQGEDWTYTWQCGDEQHNTNEEEFKITVQFKQSCKCKGCRESFCSEWSDAETLTDSDKPKVTVKPQSSVFTGDTVTLICDVRRTIYWFKNFERIKACSKTETLREVRVSDGGRYACSVENKTALSQGVMLTVEERPKPVVRVQPDGRVFRGQTVTLTCDIQDTNVTNWSYSWNKDDSETHVSQSQEYRISSVSESHTGNYSCTGRETGGSRYSHSSEKVTLTVSGSEAPLLLLSVFKLLSFLLVASPYLLVSIILGVKCYRAHAESN